MLSMVYRLQDVLAKFIITSLDCMHIRISMSLHLSSNIERSRPFDYSFSDSCFRFDEEKDV